MSAISRLGAYSNKIIRYLLVFLLDRACQVLRLIPVNPKKQILRWISSGNSSFNSSVLNVNIITDKEASSGRRGSQIEGTVLIALASHICDLGLSPSVNTICGLGLLLVLYSAPRGFLHDLQFSTLQFDLESGITWKPKGLSVLRTVKCQPSFLKKTIFRR